MSGPTHHSVKVQLESASLLPPDAEVEVEGVPVAPLDVRCHDANKDYVVVTWKQPAVEGSSPILGYYIDRFTAPQWLHVHVPQKWNVSLPI